MWPAETIEIYNQVNLMQCGQLSSVYSDVKTLQNVCRGEDLGLYEGPGYWQRAFIYQEVRYPLLISNLLGSSM